MNRLTRKDTEFNGYTHEEAITSDLDLGECLTKLAAYEDTGLKPEQIKELIKEYNKYSTLSAHYEQLEEQGLLIKLPPIKTGDTLYWIWGDQIMPVKCRGIDRDVGYKMTTKEDRAFNKFDGTPFVYEKGDIRYFYAKDFGKTVFTTQKEAEKALKEMEGR